MTIRTIRTDFYYLRPEILLGLWVPVLFSRKGEEETLVKPNITYIMSDDNTTLGFGIYGSRLSGLAPRPNS